MKCSSLRVQREYKSLEVLFDNLPVKYLRPGVQEKVGSACEQGLPVRVRYGLLGGLFVEYFEDRLNFRGIQFQLNSVILLGICGRWNAQAQNE